MTPPGEPGAGGNGNRTRRKRFDRPLRAPAHPPTITFTHANALIGTALKEELVTQ